MGEKNKLQKYKSCKWWAFCEDCGKRVSDKFDREVDAAEAALKHRDDNEGHHLKVETNCKQE